MAEKFDCCENYCCQHCSACFPPGTDFETNARLIEIEHEVAESAIAVRKFVISPLQPDDTNHKQWWDEYQRLFHIRVDAEDALIKFKADEGIV